MFQTDKGPQPSNTYSFIDHKMYALSSSWENVMLKRYRPIVSVDNMTGLVM
jgi:hypothetical protein